MFDRILVPLDGSALSDRAVPFAESLAKRAGGQLLLVRAVDTWTLLDGGRSGRREHELRLEAERQLAAASHTLQENGLDVAWSVTLGEPAMVIAETRHANVSDLIVMSTHGRGGLGRLAYGSVAERVLRLGACPVLLIPPEVQASWRSPVSGPIVVPLDGSPLAEEALQPAGKLAQLFGAPLSVVQVIEPPPVTAYDGWNVAPVQYLDVEQWAEEARPYAEGVVQGLRSSGYAAEAQTLTGYAAATIDRHVRDKQAVAVVMASHGRSGIVRMVLGSVAQGVVQRTSVPVLVVTPAAIREDEVNKATSRQPAAAGG